MRHRTRAWYMGGVWVSPNPSGKKKSRPHTNTMGPGFYGRKFFFAGPRTTLSDWATVCAPELSLRRSPIIRCVARTGQHTPSYRGSFSGPSPIWSAGYCRASGYASSANQNQGCPTGPPDTDTAKWVYLANARPALVPTGTSHQISPKPIGSIWTRIDTNHGC